MLRLKKLLQPSVETEIQLRVLQAGRKLKNISDVLHLGVRVELHLKPINVHQKNKRKAASKIQTLYKSKDEFLHQIEKSDPIKIY